MFKNKYLSDQKWNTQSTVQKIENIFPATYKLIFKICVQIVQKFIKYFNNFYCHKLFIKW